MTDLIKIISDATFEAEALQSDLPVLVDFWAEWCGPCRALAPILEDVAHEYMNKLIIAKINVDENSLSAANYNVRGIPALLLFKNGELVDTKVGALSKGQLTTFLDAHLIS